MLSKEKNNKEMTIKKAITHLENLKSQAEIMSICDQQCEPDEWQNAIKALDFAVKKLRSLQHKKRKRSKKLPVVIKFSELMEITQGAKGDIYITHDGKGMLFDIAGITYLTGYLAEGVIVNPEKWYLENKIDCYCSACYYHEYGMEPAENRRFKVKFEQTKLAEIEILYLKSIAKRHRNSKLTAKVSKN
ncbi:MAG: hypothetical protein LBI42_09575 [Chitinispirillales bacterium]|jgi:hypothetical protein|nr:hypothetical protein [Chitinispirillales bacterium]